nr:unnamed protein product [Callosobruchus chinensis]
MTGPKIQSDLFSILLRFRKHNIVLVADIEKMYRMVYIAEKHRDYQRIMWRGNPSSEISHFRLNTVTYGLSASPYLAIRSLNQAAIEQREAYPESSDAIINDMYVDDLISGSSDIESASQLRADITKVLSPYGFKLRKWCANDPSVLEGSSSTNSINTDSYYLCKDEIRHALGLTWYPNQDMLSYAFNIEFPNKRITKRVVLSVVASIFDPLGLMSLVIISFKILLQQLWQQNLQWDEPLPLKLLDVWNHLISDIDLINSIQVSRHILVNHPVHVKLHCFSDASQSAYGCCIYIKSIDATGQALLLLVCSKSRVAPLKTLSIPRIELCGAVLSTRLSKKVSQALKININACYYWVDSTIVLSWISTCPSKLKVFVSNRIAEIQRCTNVQQWAHVASSDNPADLVSRGLNATELKQCTLWWNGPSWLVHKQADWPKISEVEVEIPELKPKKLTLLAREQSEFKLIERFSSLHRARRVTAWCFRFYHNLKLPAAKRNLESLSVSELNNSTIALLKLAQRTMLPDEISCIVNNKPISKKSKLVPFDPIVDKQGLLRIGGRLNKSSLPYDSKHQILLHPKHHLTRLIVLNEHYRQMHAGVYQLLCAIRQNHWILHGHRVIKTILSKCIVCFRCRPKNIIQKMADLPSHRVTPLRPFYVSGVDFCGPFLIKDGKLRNRAIIKAYLCIFICFTTKAVHLEAVRDLSSQAFLNALHRFVSRRGICHTLYSDNATNFVGSNNELTKISQEILNFTTDPEVANFMLNNSISWKSFHHDHHTMEAYGSRL